MVHGAGQSRQDKPPNHSVVHNSASVIHDKTQLPLPWCQRLDVATYYFLDEFDAIRPVPIDLGVGVVETV